MSPTREVMLEEMGLAPLWRLRRPGPESTASTPAVVPGGRAQSSAGGGAPDAAASSPAARAAVAAPAPAAPALEDAAPAEAARIAPAAADDASADAARNRSAAILRMDWAALKECVSRCCDCTLHARRNKTVFGVGDEAADWLFVGEGPGADEDAQGEPFVGQAGRLLDNMLAAIDLARGKNVYIANVVKCRPPGNRNPEPAEARACEPYLKRQIELIAPKLIVALGRVAAQNLIGREASISSLRGRVLDFNGTPLIVTYHPAYLLRNLPDKAKAWEDLCFAVKTMRGMETKT